MMDGWMDGWVDGWMDDYSNISSTHKQVKEFKTEK